MSGKKINRAREEDDFLIERLSLFVEAIAKTFGSNCEVVLHDLRQLDRSVVKIENGHVTGRKAGSSVTDLALKSLKENAGNDILLNYKTKAKNGKSLKSTTVVIKNRRNVPIAALCINIDVTILQAARSIMNEFCYVSEIEEPAKETFENDFSNTVGSIIDRVIAAAPIHQKEERIKIVANLYEQGVFLVKGTVKIVADRLNVSKYAIYNYLDEIRSQERKEGMLQ